MHSFCSTGLSSLASSCGKIPQPSPGLTPALRPRVSISTQSFEEKAHLWLYAPDHTSASLTNTTNKTHTGFGFHSIFSPLSSKLLARDIYFHTYHFPVSFNSPQLSLYCFFFSKDDLEHDQLLNTKFNNLWTCLTFFLLFLYRSNIFLPVGPKSWSTSCSTADP